MESVKIIKNEYPKSDTILPYEFCPKCGCRKITSSGNMADEYPQHWEKFYCKNCGFLVGLIDNSPFVHCLSCKDDNYEIVI